MFEILNTVEIAGEKLPVKCDFNVLQVLQEEFGTLREFEQKLIGLVPIKDSEGNIIYETDNEGNESMKFKTTEPSLKAIALVLPLMLKEGRRQADAQGDYTNKDFDYISAIKEADFDIVKLAIDLHTEYKRCYDRKKLKAHKSPATKTSR